MFEPYARNPFDTLQPDDWEQLRYLLSDSTKCFPTFSVPVSDFSSGQLAKSYANHVFPLNQWSTKDEDLLLRASVISSVSHETNCEKFTPGCRLFHVHDSMDSDEHPTLVCTDSPNKNEQRVFPWADEAEIILRYVRGTTVNPPSSLLDIFCGSGSIAISLARAWPQCEISCTDINSRALKFTQFNSILNGLGGDVAKPLNIFESNVFDNVNEKFDLIIGTPPIALQPLGEEDVEHLHSSGGATGTNVIQKLIHDCGRQLNSGGRLIFLAYGLGDCNEPLQLNQLLREEFPDGGWRIIPLPNEKIWRVGDQKRFTNPMPVQYMISRLADPTYRAQALGSYERWERWIEDDLIKDNGFSHLHYMIIEYVKPTS